MSSTVKKRYVKKDLNTIQANFELFHPFDFLISELLVLRAILNLAEVIVRVKKYFVYKLGFELCSFCRCSNILPLSCSTPQYFTSLVSDGDNLCLLVELWWRPLMVVFLEAPSHPSSATVATDSISCCDLSSAQLLLRSSRAWTAGRTRAEAPRRPAIFVCGRPGITTSLSGAVTDSLIKLCTLVRDVGWHSLAQSFIILV